jgi:acyl dehydratase
MGAAAPATAELHAAGLLPPDVVTGMTVFLLARQPAPPREAPAPTGERTHASPVAGGVWVREQCTFHRPVARDDPFTVTGEVTGRFTRRGRQYSTTASKSHDHDGRRFATNLTTGLLAYRAVEGLADTVEGLPLEETPSPMPDPEAAVENPHLDELRQARAGDVLGGTPVLVSLAMMAARDTASPDNPIHSDPEEARRAGLDRPIAGGSHVLAFALEPVMARFGPSSLLHGAHLDVRWKAPTKADDLIVPSAIVVDASPERVEFALQVDLPDGTPAMAGTLTVPLG